MNTIKLGWRLGAVFGLVLFAMASLCVAHVIQPIHFAGLVLLTAVITMLANTSLMVKTGRVKAKGAKKRRKKLLPFIYKKKNKTVLQP